jgi:uncharacterized RDD family membrane protein YckC
MRGLFFRRAVASLIDGTLISLFGWASFFVLYAAYVAALRVSGDGTLQFTEIFVVNRISSFQVQLMEGGLEFVFYFLYYSYLQAKDGQTLGKRWLKIRVIDVKTRKPPTLARSFGRTAGYILSYLPFCAGYLMAWLHPDGLALHDWMTGTRVIRTEEKS